MAAMSQKWLVLALSSGTFAALNGVFAKLELGMSDILSPEVFNAANAVTRTTTQLTTDISQGISRFLSFSASMDIAVEYIVRAFFFALNVLSNITMWALFTRALTAASSSTQVTITNTTANFLVTAILGMVVFRERVAPLWWLGATIMATGCIIVGLRDEKGTPKDGNAVEDELGGRRGGSSDDLIEFQDEDSSRRE
ncbi:hypothetical protein CPC735_055760 [Coccidioides posadasii C735 delta SOWgp]|uniref:EamA domain-containing protein n=1 Tax=Coccidioides posadasii (strain C735) TaxID=222929 RepID=C5PI53_COCP7|nr:hypothetical protein CPC735_055760 [Coccidioides posadasii C735 delta SOWgp]EER24206.1 hypothetical protein CPC735_055760 [Coccidioides posadasii C735 delta SOWgp]|eukprot:XP_003066351.1 hypothetical protein CPC735_055760 [Coccidioides posadasii C735 delta SOWgp]